MNKKLTRFLMRKVVFLSAIFFLVQLMSCKKDGELSPDFENGDLSIHFTDTFSVFTQVVQEDSLRTDLATRKLLGLYNDPIFGPVSSSIYTQVQTNGANLDFGTSPVLDSVVLTLDYDGLYGDGNPMTVQVFKLTSALDLNTDYYSNSIVSHEMSPIAEQTFTPDILNKVSVISNGDTIAADPHVRIKLDNSFGQDILSNSPYINNAAFTSIFNGLCIKVKDSVTAPIVGKKKGSIAYFDMTSSLSTVSIYYHYGFSLEPLQYNFVINSEGVNFSRFEHNYAGTDIEAHLNDLPSKDTTVTYISTMSGVKTKIEIPHIKELIKDGSVVINKAELIFTIEDGTESDIDNPLSKLSLVGIDAEGNSTFLPDFYEGDDHYGGAINYFSAFKNYSFNITRHVHDLLYETTTDYGMYLIASGSSTSANRTVLSSENSLSYKIKLEITYSKI
jgi:hypothetical protein